MGERNVPFTSGHREGVTQDLLAVQHQIVYLLHQCATELFITLYNDEL
jgi:hypothetical protein